MMETALMMMRYNEPIYPLELLTAMRDQRPMVIQTGVSRYNGQFGVHDDFTVSVNQR